MADSRAQARVAAAGPHLVLYDGVCGLCNRLLQFLLAHDHRAVFTFAPLQGATSGAMVKRFGGEPQELSSFYVVADYGTAEARAFTRSSAALFVADQLGWPWKAARVLGVLPTALLDRAYDVVAANRYRLFGRYEQCLIPRPEHRRRFVD